MERIDLRLTSEEFVELNKISPPTEKSADVGRRAINLIKHHFTSLDPSSHFSERSAEGDLEVHAQGRTIRVEVKGTTERDISWGKLKVSGTPSYEQLKSGMPLYRVCGVNEICPIVYVLKYGEDFDMVHEPRWRLKPKRA